MAALHQLASQHLFWSSAPTIAAGTVQELPCCGPRLVALRQNGSVGF